MKQSSLIIGLFFLVILFAAFTHMHSEIQTLTRDNQYYTTNYLQKQGGTSLYSTNKLTIYDLRSFDGGKAWYAVHRDTNDALIIDGDAEKVFPGLMTELKAMDSLFNHIQTNGQLNLENSNDLQLLKNVGFVISTNRSATNHTVSTNR